ncbi:zygote arrest protein 1 [Melanotaenia boesemani]|uniref:zygote arrest protein 1 n=1 Tax=Melanotaenia boesemani TaxID=1250792 RepID=UPI001C0597F3|nr:zygote arrest protein 1 [Melanotaenia boesemani]
MATYGEEPVDSYFYSSYNPYLGRYSRPRDTGWKYKSYFSQYRDTSDAFNNHQRAQLKSILSQINPKLTPRLRKANTKDVAVQVNPKKDASVQCSIGPRTLQAMKRDFQRKRRPEPATPIGGDSPKAGGAVRYPRTLAVYSPIAYRSVTYFLVDDNNNKEASSEAAQTAQTPGDPAESAGDTDGKEEEDHLSGEDGNVAKGRENDKKQKSKPQVKREGAQPAEESKSKGRVRFQFLEQKYGYYHCRDCNLRWESAYVWCVQGTNKVYFKQFCRKCQKDFNPYRVEDITCHTCNKARCCCALTQRHVDPKRPHRQDLCGRCKGKRLSCDSTFSFKYII